MRAVVMALSACAVAAQTWSPLSCSAPPGISNATVAESLCYTELVPLNPATNISVRSYGPSENWTQVVNDCGHVSFDDTPGCIQRALEYWEGHNAANASLLGARTTPVIVGGFFAGMGYFIVQVSMTLSGRIYPNASAVPLPANGMDALLPVGNRTVAVVQLNTVGLPTFSEFQTACVSMNVNTLPAGYSLDLNSHWSPAYAYYNGLGAQEYTSECWQAVFPP